MNDNEITKLKQELAKIEQAIAGQEASQAILPDDEQIEKLLQTLRKKQAKIQNALANRGSRYFFQVTLSR